MKKLFEEMAQKRDFICAISYVRRNPMPSRETLRYVSFVDPETKREFICTLQKIRA